MNRKVYLFRNVGIYAISNFTTKVLSFFLVPLYTNILSTSDLGLFDLISSTVSLIYPIITLNISSCLSLFLLEENKNKNNIISISLKYLRIGILLVVLLIFVFSRVVVITEINDFAIYIFLYYVVFSCEDFLIQIAKGYEKVKIIGIANIVSSIVLLSTNIVFLLIFNLGLKGFIITHIFSLLSSCICYLLGLKKVWKSYHPKIKSKDLEKNMLSYSLPLITSQLSWWINSSLDKYVVSAFIGISENGILSVAYKIPTILTVIQNIFIQAWQISAIKEFNRENSNVFYSTIFVYQTIFISISASILILLSKPIAYVLYAKKFFDAWKYCPFLIISVVFNCSSGLLGPILSANKDAKTLSKAAIIGAITNAIANIVLVNAIGIQGAAISTLISSIVIYIIRKKKIMFDLYNYKKIEITWLLIIIESIFVIYTNYYIVDFFIVLFIIAINYQIIRNMLVELVGVYKKVIWKI